jgi:hypothetical protein
VSLLPLNASKIALTIDNTKLNQSAVQNPSTLNPSTNLSVNNIITALMINKNNPRVKNVIGNDNIVSIGLTIVFRNAKTTATKNAVKNLLISAESKLKN